MIVTVYPDHRVVHESNFAAVKFRDPIHCSLIIDSNRKKLQTCRVRFAGYMASSHKTWLKQMARELTNHENGGLRRNQI